MNDLEEPILQPKTRADLLSYLVVAQLIARAHTCQ